MWPKQRSRHRGAACEKWTGSKGSSIKRALKTWQGGPRHKRCATSLSRRCSMVKSTKRWQMSKSCLRGSDRERLDQGASELYNPNCVSHLIIMPAPGVILLACDCDITCQYSTLDTRLNMRYIYRLSVYRRLFCTCLSSSDHMYPRGMRSQPYHRYNSLPQLWRIRLSTSISNGTSPPHQFWQPFLHNSNDVC